MNGVIKVNDVTIDVATATKKGGFIYSDGTVQVTMTNTVIKNMEAESGGFMFADSELYKATAFVPKKESFVKFEVTNTFDTMKAIKTGGVFYVNH